ELLKHLRRDARSRGAGRRTTGRGTTTGRQPRGHRWLLRWRWRTRLRWGTGRRAAWSAARCGGCPALGHELRRVLHAEPELQHVAGDGATVDQPGLGERDHRVDHLHGRLAAE